MNLSKATIRQLLAVNVCRGITEQVPVSFELAAKPMSGHVGRLVRLVLFDCDDIRKDLETRNRIVTIDGVMQMEQKTYARYMRAYNAARAVFRVPGRDIMAATHALTGSMAIAAEMATQAPDRERKLDWNSLENRLTDLYQYYDPDLSDTDAMRQGVRDCEALMRITQ